MDDFCRSEFWNENLTWNANTPYFTYCFEETVLSVIPAAFLAVFAIVDISIIGSSKEKVKNFKQALNLVTFTQFILSIALILTYVVHIVRLSTPTLPGTFETIGPDYLSYAAHVFAYILAMFLNIVGKYYCVGSSGVQFLYWFAAAVCEAILFRTAVLGLGDEENAKEKIIYLTRIIVFPLTVLQLILQCVNPNWFSRKDIKIKMRNPSPDKSSTFFSKLLFLWYDSLAWTGYRNPLTTESLWDLNPVDSSQNQVPIFAKHWNTANRRAAIKNSKSGKYKLTGIMGPLFKCYGWTFAWGSVLKLSADLLVFVQPEMVERLVAHMSVSSEPVWRGYLYTGVLFAAATVQTILNGASSKRVMLIGMRIKTVLANAVFKKSLVISNAAKRDYTLGEIVNLMSVDTQKFVEVMPLIGTVWSSPIQIGISVYLLYNTLGESVFAGLAILILLIPLNGFVATLSRKYQMAQMKLKDKRIKLINEVLSGIKVLKLYAWEPSYEQHIDDIRQQEIVLLRKAAYLNCSTVFTFQCAPFLVAIATFSTYVLSNPKYVLNSERTFVALSLFNIIRMPMTQLPVSIANIIQTSVSVNRLNKFLNAEELEENAVTHDESYADPLVIKHGTFSWTDETTTLKYIDLSVKQGELVAVVGTIGSGKTSLLCAFLGGLKKQSGTVNTKGTIAYVAQGAWIQNATLRENILFGDPLNSSKYEAVLAACALKQDLEILSEGDLTEIGEKGINLSGGQKQRVALARSAYKEADIYLFDDALSAVDAHVGKVIFENLIGPAGRLRGKTRVLVTHGITFLPQMDRIVVMKDGRISESGTYRELLMKKGEFAEFLVQHIGTKENEEKEHDTISLIHDLEEVIGSDQLMQKKSSTGKPIRQLLQRLPSKEEQLKVQKPVAAVAEDKKVIQDETSAIGNLPLKVYLDYIKAAGVRLSISSQIFNVIGNALMAYSNIWLSDWSTQATIDEKALNGTSDQSTTNKYLTGYGALGAGQAVSILIAVIAMSIGCLRSTSNLHSKALSHVMKSPMSYFDTTPLGRLVNRFSKDVETTDNLIPMNIRPLTNTILSVLSTFIVISYTTPVFIAFIIPMSILYFFLQRFYVATSRQLKRLESVSRSPVYSHFGATISGAITIRAFKLQDEFITEFDKRIDFNQQTFFPYIVSNTWIAMRFEFIGALIILFSCIFALLERNNLTGGSAGLTITYALQVTSLLNFIARFMSDLETNFVSVERLIELTVTPQEADWRRPRNKPDGKWPHAGHVIFDNYMTRYREELDLVLRGITFTIKPGEKVGIVGRTGAGKSSLTLALFRLIEPAGGKILIDNVDISTIGLHDLREKITIIPQDPVLFSGTLRQNLDPSDSYSDEQVWKCLELANLKPFVQTLSDGLRHTVEEEGHNFSIGQRQILCSARALLRKTSILVLDEATASVDLETDDLIQKTIRKEFSDATVITIAHRLHTIMDSNRVLVLDQGQIKEFASPSTLLEDTDSIFYGMAKDAKIV